MRDSFRREKFIPYGGLMGARRPWRRRDPAGRQEPEHAERSAASAILWEAAAWGLRRNITAAPAALRVRVPVGTVVGQPAASCWPTC